MRIKSLFLLPALIAGLCLVTTGESMAEHLTVLHTFGSIQNDGANPYADLILSGNTLYGTAAGGGGLYGGGTVFKVSTDGGGFTNLLTFTNSYFNQGYTPYSRLVLVDDALYGTTLHGGSGAYDEGTVFKVKADGTGFTSLHRFTFRGSPFAGLIFPGDRLYGTTAGGGTVGFGSVFAMNLDGGGFTNLYSLDGRRASPYAPQAPLALSGNTLYGTGYFSSEPGFGGIFAVNTGGGGYTNLCLFNHNYFTAGSSPVAGLVLSGNTLYGTATRGGTASPRRGTVFAINTDSTGLTNLHSFTGSDGAYPSGGLTLSGRRLYGTAKDGGTFGGGTVFAINTDSTGFTNLYSFTAHAGNSNSEGFGPYAGLVLAGETLYGTTPVGGTFSVGTVFKLVLSNSPPMVTCPDWGIFECGVVAPPLTLQVSDPDGDPLIIVWTLNGTPVQTNSLPGDPGPPPHLPYPHVAYYGPRPFGSNLLEVSVADSATNLASCSTELIVLDTTPPMINALSADPDVLWPPNHKWVDVQISADITDACGEVDWRVIDVSSNQEDPTSPPDCVITGGRTLKLRAERREPGGDRIYIVTIQAMDQSGNLSEPASTAVVVPHSRSRGR